MGRKSRRKRERRARKATNKNSTQVQMAATRPAPEAPEPENSAEKDALESMQRLIALLKGQDGQEQEKQAPAHQEKGMCAHCQGLEEYEFRFRDPWSTSLFIRFLRSRGIEPYRSKGQHRTTVRFGVEEKCWEELEESWNELSKRLHKGFESHFFKLAAEL